MADTYWDRKTLTGMTLKEVYARIDADLGPNAYAGIFGTNLTDIKPPFVYELLTECFGLHGDGWGFDVLEVEYIGSVEKTSKKGRDYTEHDARARVTCWYRTVDDERVFLAESVGGSQNEVRQYAEQGAITNAAGNGWGKTLGVQRHIYKNEPAPEPEAPEDKPKSDYERMTALAKANKTGDAVRDKFAEWDVPATLASWRKLATDAIAELNSIAGGA